MKLRICLIVLSVLGAAKLHAQEFFVANKGQWADSILFRAELPNAQFHIERKGFRVYLFDHIQAHPDEHGHAFGFMPGDTFKAHTFFIAWENAQIPAAQGLKKRSEYYNYFLGSDPKHWASHVPVFEEILLSELYPGIDVQIFGTGKGEIKYNFLVKPGADPNQIKWRYHGLDGVSLHGFEIKLETSLGQQREYAPLAYQESTQSKAGISVRYQEAEPGLFGFRLGEYRKTETLVIDPVLVFSTYTGSFADNFGFTATYDSKGNAFGGGDTRDIFNGNWVPSLGAFQRTFGGGTDNQDLLLGDVPRDVAIMKFAPDGKSMLYATYLGGNRNEQPHSMVVDSKDNLVVFGTTFSANFPGQGTGAQKSIGGSADVFVAKLSEDGSQLLGMSYIGGSGRDGLNGSMSNSGTNTDVLGFNFGDYFRGEVVVDGFDNVLIASCTQSSQAQGFPVKNGFNNNFGGYKDGFICKLNANLTQIEWCSYIGGADEETAYGLALDQAGNIFVCGGTNSNSMNISMSGPLKNYQGGKADGYVLKIASNGTTILSGTYLGTSLYDQAYFVQVDKFGQVYLTGQTEGNWQAFPSNVYHEAEGGQFIVKFDNSLNTRLIQTTFGKGSHKPQLSPTAFLVDSCERVFFAGWGGQTNEAPFGNGGSTRNQIITPDAFQKTTDTSDFYLIVFTKGIRKVLYATYMGGGTLSNPLGEHVDGGTSRFDPKGVVYHSVCGGCGASATPDFPTTQGAFSRRNNSNNCNNAVFKIDFENLNQAPRVQDTLIRIVAGTFLQFDYFVRDADDDSVYIVYSSSFLSDTSLKFTKPQLVPGQSKGFSSLKNTWVWQSGCEHMGLDTIVIQAIAHDEGCPEYKTDTAYIRIVVLPPPAPEPPDVICMTFLNDDRIRLTWQMPDSNIYLDQYILFRKRGQDPWEAIDTIGAVNEFIKIDSTAISNHKTNYCYKIVGRNACGMPGDTSYTICTIDQRENPIGKGEIFTTTVHNDKEVHTYWFSSKEPDFQGYTLWKKTNDGSSQYQIIKEIDNQFDTSYQDSDVEVDLYSYCYIITVADKCENSSVASNEGCSILLQGESIPYQHNLNWSEYRQWSDGVMTYQLLRHDDRQIQLPVQRGDATFLQTIDTSLDYDWGAYWYEIRAKESGGNEARSRSNRIKLIQKPLLHVPTAFTPNGDYLNEVWGIVDVFVKDYKLLVYNRWGQKVLETNDKNYQWDAYFRGEDPFDAVFIWYVVYTGWDGSKHSQKGTLTILR